MSRVDGLIGAVLVAVIISSILFGILTVQTHSYFSRFPNDTRWLKVMIGVLWVVDCAHQICACMISYDYMIGHYHDPSYLLRNISPLSTAVVLEPIPALIVQCYYARRLYLLNPRWWPAAGLTVILALCAFCFGEACGIAAYSSRFLQGLEVYTWAAWVWLVTCGACDLLVSSAIAYQLWTSRGGSRQTEKLIVKLTVWTVNTGIAPAALALVNIITFVCLNDLLVHLGINIVLAKLYGNSALAFLNRRVPERRMSVRVSVSGPGDIPLSTIASTTTKSFNSVVNPRNSRDRDNDVRFEVSKYIYANPLPVRSHKQVLIESPSRAPSQRTKH